MDVLAPHPHIIHTKSKIRYCEHPFRYVRRKTREVKVGDVGIGGNNPIRVQSMTTTDTMDTEATVRQVIDLYEAGCEIVRITAPSIKDAENLRNIRDGLRRQGIKIPLVADIHFTPNAAMKAAEFVEKVRINPGNYADKKKFAVIDYSDSIYEKELERLEEAFRPLVLKCKEYGIAMRIGTNHGSLSDRIMSRYGDTPLGMVESALEFVSICERYDYRNIVLSMKSSNVQVMIAAYRLLAARMYELGMDYPFHLGVTEAGDGEDGRIKSAIGIGSLLEDGIGDTIRVSLTEDSVHEIPAARAIAAGYDAGRNEIFTEPAADLHEPRDPFNYARRWSQTVELPAFNYGGVHHVRVEVPLQTPIGDTPHAFSEIKSLCRAGTEEIAKAEIIRCEITDVSQVSALQKIYEAVQTGRLPVVISACVVRQKGLAEQAVPFCDRLHFLPSENWKEEITTLVRAMKGYDKKGLHLEMSAEWDRVDMDAATELAAQWIQVCYREDFKNVSISLNGEDPVHINRVLVAKLHQKGLPSAVGLNYQPIAQRPTLFEASIQIGALLCDGIGDAIYIGDHHMNSGDLVRLSFNILQAARLRISKTEFISCPSCGRTLFDLQEVTARIKSKTGHLKGVKIAIMGCIVNGPGEMADADFGYVGSGVGKINLYVGKELVERNIDMADADQRLIDLIKSKGLWNEPQ